MSVLLPSGFVKNPNFHAYLFVSPDAGARHGVSRLMAKSILCRNRRDNAQPCGECDSCIKMKAQTHPDCIIVSTKAKTKVDDIRKIIDEAYLATNEADFKVFILEDADEYNVQSHNVLLKVIEEPPAHARFILTASSVGAILPTVRSRVCSLQGDVRDIDSIAEDIKNVKPFLDEEKTRVLMHFVDGYDKADIASLDEEKLCEYVNTAYLFLSGKDTTVLMSLPVKREDLQKFKTVLQVFMLCIRQLVLAKTKGRLTEGIMSTAQLSECNKKISMKRAHALYDLFEECYLNAEDGANLNAILGCLLKA